jgi:hypothetical protein
MSNAVFGQSHNYWTRSFNEESSLLSGAVVGGGAGPSAIYYNPALISEIKSSKLSFHASLFALNIYNSKNTLGEGIDLTSTKIQILPRFLSYMIKPKKNPNWSFEIAFLNNEIYELEAAESVDQNMDILTHLPGEERYFATFNFRNYFRDDWIGIGGSWNIRESLYLGASMFAVFRHLEYDNVLDIEAFPLSDSITVGGEFVPFYSATYQYSENIRFNDYRLLWKFGLMYQSSPWSIGLSVTSPSVHIFADGKRVYRKLKQANISDPETGEPLPDFVVADLQDKDNVTVNFKSPLSVAAGVNYSFGEKSRVLYSTVEYFAGLDPYRIISANENPQLAGGTVFENINLSEWLTFVGGARPVLNVAVGYRSIVAENLMLLAGFRTDFNYRLGMDYSPLTEHKIIQGLDVDVYHLSGGLTLTVLGQDLILGIQYSIGAQGDQKQIYNLSDPVEFNYTESAALQGTRQNTMKTTYNSLSLYFGATLNFGGEKK